MATKTKTSINERIEAIYTAVTALRQQAMICAADLVNLIWFDEEANTEAIIEKTGFKSISEWFRKDPKMGSSAFNAVYLGIVNKAAVEHVKIDPVDSIGAAKILKANLVWQKGEPDAGQKIKEAGPEMAVSKQLHARLRAYNVLIKQGWTAMDAAKKACQIDERGINTKDSEAVVAASEEGSDKAQTSSTTKSALVKAQERLLSVQQLMAKMSPEDFETLLSSPLLNKAACRKARKEQMESTKEATAKK